MIRLDQEICKGCGSCAKVCPFCVFEVNDGKAILSGEERCIECGACQLNCNHKAIVVTKGVGCLFAIIRDDILKIKQSQVKTTGIS